MAIAEKQVYEKVVSEIIATPRVAHYTVDYVLEAGETRLKPYKLNHLDSRRDFQNNYGDEIVVGLSISTGDYYRYVEPNKQNLFFSLVLTPIGETGDAVQSRYETRKTRYRAISTTIADRDLQGLPSYSDDMAMMQIDLQLIPLALWELRTVTAGGMFYQEKTIDVLRTLVGYHSRNLTLPDEDSIVGVEYIEASNQQPRENIIITHDRYLLDLPGFLQKHCGGIYNQGIGMYLHNRVWFIYPLYDNTLYDKAEYAIDVFIVPPNRFYQNARTFQIKDERLQILSGTEVHQINPSDIYYLTKGNGVRFTQATKFFEEYATVEGTKVETKAQDRLAEFTFRARKDDIQHIPFAPEMLTDNIAQQMTKIATRVGQTVNVKWDNARPDLLRPGMAVKLYYGNEGGFAERMGQLLAVEIAMQPAASGLTATRYVTTCMLTLFIEHDE